MWYCNIKTWYDLQLVKSQMQVEVYTGLSPNKFSFDLEVMVFPDIKAITEFFANIFHFSYATMDISRAFISSLLSPKNMITLHSCGKASQICKTLLGVFKPPCILGPEPRTEFSVSTSILRCQKMSLKKKKKTPSWLANQKHPYQQLWFALSHLHQQRHLKSPGRIQGCSPHEVYQGYVGRSHSQ